MLEAYIKSVKNKKQALMMPYLTAGANGLSELAETLLSYERAGSDIIEVGIPFSDPSADGPIIQDSCDRAIKGGFEISAMFTQIKKARLAGLKNPLVLFGYLNPFLQYGMDKIVKEAKECGVAGLLILDLPVEESQHVRQYLQEHGLSLIYLVSPTTGEQRRKKIFEMAQGFVYCVARAGITGEKTDFNTEYLQRTKEECPVPLAVGFGIQEPAQVEQLKAYADVVVVGSALVRTLMDSGLERTHQLLVNLNSPLVS